MITTLAIVAALNLPISEYQSVPVPVPVAKYCAKLVGIPYASDNFSPQEWERFTDCVYMQMGEKK
jgi:hypothetical protein